MFAEHFCYRIHLRLGIKRIWKWVMFADHFCYRIHLRLGIKRIWKWVYTCALSGRNIFLMSYHRIFAGILLHFQTLILSVGPFAGRLSDISYACCLFLHRWTCTCFLRTPVACRLVATFCNFFYPCDVGIFLVF